MFARQLGSMVWQQCNVLEHSTVESLKAFFEVSVHKTYPESLFNPSALRQQLLGFFFQVFHHSASVQAFKNQMHLRKGVAHETFGSGMSRLLQLPSHCLTNRHLHGAESKHWCSSEVKSNKLQLDCMLQALASICAEFIHFYHHIRT